MNKYRCSKCNGDQYSAVSEIKPCIYCGADDVKLMGTVETIKEKVKVDSITHQKRCKK